MINEVFKDVKYHTYLTFQHTYLKTLFLGLLSLNQLNNVLNFIFSLNHLNNP